jgi:hypothetical protein
MILECGEPRAHPSASGAPKAETAPGCIGAVKPRDFINSGDKTWSTGARTASSGS